jgi:hypothetical protein
MPPREVEVQFTATVSGAPVMITGWQVVVVVVVRPPSKDGWMNTLMYSLMFARASIRARRRKKLSFGPTVAA